jgi:hypothetical protein
MTDQSQRCTVCERLKKFVMWCTSQGHIALQPTLHISPFIVRKHKGGVSFKLCLFRSCPGNVIPQLHEQVAVLSNPLLSGYKAGVGVTTCHSSSSTSVERNKGAAVDEDGWLRECVEAGVSVFERFVCVCDDELRVCG